MIGRTNAGAVAGINFTTGTVTRGDSSYSTGKSLVITGLPAPPQMAFFWVIGGANQYMSAALVASWNKLTESYQFMKAFDANAMNNENAPNLSITASYQDGVLVVTPGLDRFSTGYTWNYVLI